MAVREDVVQSAVSFLNNPKVQASPLARRIAFLESKGLTSEEIEEALARTKGGTTTSAAAVAAAPPPLPSTPAHLAHHGHSHAVMAPAQPGWMWKDYVLAAGAAAAAGYGLWQVSKTYLAPLVSWATPASLDADRQAFEARMSATEASIERVREQTAAATRLLEQQKADVERAVSSLSAAAAAASSAVAARDSETRRIEDEVDKLNAMLPQKLEQFKEDQRMILTEVQAELKSLKGLLLNRRPAGDVPAASLPSAITPAFAGASSSFASPLAGGAAARALPITAAAATTPSRAATLPDWQLSSSPAPAAAAAAQQTALTTSQTAASETAAPAKEDTAAAALPAGTAQSSAGEAAAEKVERAEGTSPQAEQAP